MKRVLIVDSSNLIRLTIRRVLEDHGLEIIELVTATELIENPQLYENIDLIMLDGSFIERDGTTILEKMKTIKIVMHIPIMLLIDRSDEAVLQKAFCNGVIGYIRKPFTEQSIVTQVNYILGPSDNIKLLYSTVRKEVSRAERGNNIFSMIGIQISDNLEPMKQLAVIDKITTILREIDSIIVDRVRGIILVLPFTRADKIAIVVERIRKTLILEGYPQASFSYVSFPQDGDNENELITAVEKKKNDINLIKVCEEIEV